MKKLLLQAGTFVPKGPSDESSLNPPLLRPSSPSMLDVGCSMFDVHPIARMGACGDNVGVARPRRPTGEKSQESRFKNASAASATHNSSEARLAWPPRSEGKQDKEAAPSSTFDLRPSTFDLRPSTFDLRPSTLFHFDISNEHDRSVVPP
jgi:hypothetical protein